MSEPEEERPGLTEAQFWHDYQRYPYLLAKAALWGLGIGVLYWLFTNVEAVLFPVLISLLTAYLLDPAVGWLESVVNRFDLFKRTELSRTMAIVVFMFIIVLALFGFALVLYPALARQIGTVTQKFPQLLALIQESLFPWIEETFEYALPADISTAMTEHGDTIREQLPQVAQKISQWVGSAVSRTGAVVASVLNLVMIPLFTFYFLRDFDRMKSSLAEFVPLARRDFYKDRIKMMDEVIGAWFRGQVTVALILAVLYSLGLALVFGLAGVGAGTGVAIGILSGVLNIIPYFGFLIGFILSLLMVLLDWGGWWPLIGVVSVFTVVQMLEGYIITPRVVGEKVGLSPVVVIIVLLLGGELFGLLGVLLAVPVAGILRTLLPDIIAYYKRTPFYSGDYPEAAARAAYGTYSSAEAVEMATGFSEEADAALDVDDSEATEISDVAAADADALKEPVAGSDARVEEAPAAMEPGTDGDAETDEEHDASAAQVEVGEGPRDEARKEE